MELNEAGRAAATHAYANSLPTHKGQLTTAEQLLALHAALRAYEEARGGLLRKYLQHVVECEGTDFLHIANDPASSVKFSADELAELQYIADKVRL